MQLWYPPTDRPHLLEWWQPLMRASWFARLDEVPWPIYLDEFVLIGRVERKPRSAIWVYRHGGGRGELYVDYSGQTYEFTATPKAKGPGRFTPCDVRVAIHRADLPAVVQPVWYRDPQLERYMDHLSQADPEAAAELAPEAQPEPAPAPPPVRRRGHLTVHDGGRSLAG